MCDINHVPWATASVAICSQDWPMCIVTGFWLWSRTLFAGRIWDCLLTWLLPPKVLIQTLGIQIWLTRFWMGPGAQPCHPAATCQAQGWCRPTDGQVQLSSQALIIFVWIFLISGFPKWFSKNPETSKFLQHLNYFIHWGEIFGE